MVRVMHIDDEPAARAHLALLLRDLGDQVQLVGQYADITTGQQALLQHQPDLLLLDVEMPGGDGFELLRRLGRWPFDVVFTTAFQRYAIEAIRFSALDYLMKPVQADELHAAIERHLTRRADTQDPGHQAAVVENLSAREPEALSLLVRHGGRQHALRPNDILYCRAEDNYTEIHMLGGRRFLSARTLKDYDDMLHERGFLRVHRSYLVNRQAIRNAPPNGPLRLCDGTEVEVSQRKRAEVMRALEMGARL